MADQLPLTLALPDSATFSNFIAGPNRQLHTCVEASAAGTGEALVYLWGEPGLGKTHLLQAACRACGERGATAVYLPLIDEAAIRVEMLEGLEQMSLVCLDDIDSIAGRRDWEEAVFHCYNRLHHHGGQLLVAASARPAVLPFTLPDLVSRLSFGLTFQVQALNDDDKIAVLSLRAKARGLELSEEAGRYLLTRLPRELPALIDWLNTLDQAALAAQRRITIPFIREVMLERG